MVTPKPATAPVRVLVVDDQLPFREAARALVETTAGFQWVGAASSGEEGVRTAEHLRPDLVLMDLRMPGLDGIAAAREMVARGVGAIVVLVTADEPVDAAAGGPAAVISKHRLNRAQLRRLWEEHGPLRPGGPPTAPPACAA